MNGSLKRLMGGSTPPRGGKELAGDFAFQSVRQVPAFYSQLAEALRNAPDRMFTTGNSIKAWLTGNAPKLGIKKDEIEWSGINDYLDLRGKEKVTKDEIAAFLSENGVKVEDVVLGDAKSGVDEWEVVRNGREDYDVIDGGGNVVEAGFLARQSAQEFIDTERKNDSEGAKFSQYVVPGGTNYRELLITLPDNRGLPDGFRIVANESTAKSAKKFIVEGLDGHRYASGDTHEEATKRYLEYHQSADTFKSSHFDTPNILAHLRFDERTDANGERVLFIQEAQSDWSQKGRKEGFGSNEPTAKEISDEIEKMKYEGYEMDIAILDPYKPSADPSNRGFVVFKNRYSDILGAPKRKTEKEAWEAVAKKNLSSVVARRVATAPFVTDTKAWVALALKRAIMYAVQHGMTRVAWANGQQNADHYDLSKQVDKIEVRPNQIYRSITIEHNGGSSTLDVNNDGIVTSGQDRFIGKPLDEVVGKDVADRLMKAETKETLSGLNLKVGGEGMRAFYDQIVPQVANDVLKKLGGGKVETVEILAPYNLGERYVGGKLEKIQTAPMPNPQQGFTITPAMADKVLSGVPLFAKRQDQTETPQFKKWFGDWESVANATMPRHATTLDDAKSEAKSFVGTPIENRITKLKATVSNGTLGKMASESAGKKSTSMADHSLAIANADKLFTNAVLDYSHADRNGEPTILSIHRYVAPMITERGDVVAVKMTVKETTSEKQPNPLYSIETLEIENPPSVLSLANPNGTGIRPQAGFTSNLVQALQSVNPDAVSKVVDAEGKPLVVYHGTMTSDLFIFRGLVQTKANVFDTEMGHKRLGCLY